jgi:hypothetical protein
MMREQETGNKIKNVDPLTLTLFVLRNNRYSPTEKLIYLSYNLLCISVAMSIIGVILLIFEGASPTGSAGQAELRQAYGTYGGILIIGVPAILFFRKIMYAQYKGMYIALMNKEGKEEKSDSV